MNANLSNVRFQLNIHQRKLLIDGKPTKLGARAFDVLLALVERRGRAVTKDELLDAVWPGTIVEENNLQVHISTLRKLLGPQTISTIPGRGYCLTAEVSTFETAPGPSASPPESRAPVARQGQLFGRDADINAITELLQEHAHVSIVGAGGIGKTRLAQAVVADRREQFQHGLGVRWVELAALSDGGLVIGAIAQAIGVSPGGEQPLLETVIALLRHENTLLVLDNCEHLLDAVAEVAQTLIASAPRLRILVTSQEALHTRDEHIYRLAGLPTESTTDAPAAACALFVVCAEAADSRLRLTRANFTTIADICRRLDGMPLAIQLAAARVRLLGIDGVHARLDERFRILTGGTRAVLRRHQTLRAALEWSHNLVSADEKVVFRRLGVFVGGFTLELAQDVVADERIDRWAVLDLLGQLVDKSLVVADGAEVPRYRQVETMRMFALEHLAAAGETLTTLRRHAEALLAFLVPVDDQHWTWTMLESLRHAAELDNLRAALTWAESRDGDRALACALIGSSRRIWMASDRLNEGVEHACRLMPLPDGLATEAEARFSMALGALGYMGARRECFVAAARAAQLYRSLAHESRLTDALIAVALIGARRGEAEQAAAAIAEAESLMGVDTHPRQAAALAFASATHFAYLGQYERAVAADLQQAEIYRANGDELGVQLALARTAFDECALGRTEAAIIKLRDAIAAMQQINASHRTGISQAYLACAYALHGDCEEALTNGRAAAPDLQRVQTVAWMLPFIALVHAQQRSIIRGAALIGYFDGEVTRTGRVFPPLTMQARDKTVALLEEALGHEEVRRQAEAGAWMTEEQSLALAFDSP